MDEKGVDRLILIVVVAIIALVAALAVGFAIIPENPNVGETILDLPSISDVFYNPAVANNTTSPNHNNTTNHTNTALNSTKDVKNTTDDKTDVKHDDKKDVKQDSTSDDKSGDKDKNKDINKDKDNNKDKNKDKDKDKTDDKTDDITDSDTNKVAEKSWKTVGTYSNSQPSFSLNDNDDKYKITVTAKGEKDENGELDIEVINGESVVQSKKLSVSDGESNEITMEGSGAGNYNVALDGDNIKSYSVTIYEYS